MYESTLRNQFMIPESGARGAHTTPNISGGLDPNILARTIGLNTWCFVTKRSFLRCVVPTVLCPKLRREIKREVFQE